MSPLDLSLLFFFAVTFIKIAVDFVKFMNEEPVSVPQIVRVPVKNVRYPKAPSYRRMPQRRPVSIKRAAAVPEAVREERKRIAA